VTSHSRHKKHKSNIVNFDETRGRKNYPEEHRRGPYTSANPNGGELYYVSEIVESANGPGGEYITYPPTSQSDGLQLPDGEEHSRRDSHFAALLPQRAYTSTDGPAADGPPYDSDDDMSEMDDFSRDQSRFSRDYQFTIASPEEEVTGRAVALFDFKPENDNELGLVEGQVILVSFKYGQGWLVAQDPRTGDRGLVPEEYVRLLRDIEGGWDGLMEAATHQDPPNGNENVLSPGPEARTPTQADHRTYTPVISTFSTTTKDLEPYPKELLGTPTNSETSGIPKSRDSSKERSSGDANETEKPEEESQTGGTQNLQRTTESTSA
jgi:hypothetical protein